MHPANVHHVPLFDGVRRRQRAALAALADEIDVPAGKELLVAGDRASEFFVILEGRATATVASGRRRRLEAGSFFGEIGLLRGSPRTATVVAATPMRLLVIGRREFSTLVSRFPLVGARIAGVAEARS